MTLDEFDLVMDVHLTGTAYVTHAAWPHMYEQRYGRVVFTSSGSGIFGNFGQSNLRGRQDGHARTCQRAGPRRRQPQRTRQRPRPPAQQTRMTNTVPGRDENLAEPDPNRHPALVSPAVLFMCSEDGSERCGPSIASGGNYHRSEVWVNDAVQLGAGATYEDLLPHVDRLLDMSNAHPAGTEGASTAAHIRRAATRDSGRVAHHLGANFRRSASGQGDLPLPSSANDSGLWA